MALNLVETESDHGRDAKYGCQWNRMIDFGAVLLTQSRMALCSVLYLTYCEVLLTNTLHRITVKLKGVAWQAHWNQDQKDMSFHATTCMSLKI